MSSTIRSCAEDHRITGKILDDFLYVDGKPSKGVKKEHTYEELWAKLEQIRINAWDSYDTVKNDLNW